MLGGKDFRGRQQRALVAGVDHLQHRQHRDDGLAGADLALQQPVHRLGRGQFGRDHVEHLALSAGQLERQPVHQRGRQAVVAARRGGPGFRQLAVAALHQRPLQPDGLVEGQPLAGAPRARPRSRRGGWRAARRPRTSDHVGAQRFPAADRRSGPARRAPGARRRRCPSSAAWRWPGRSGRSRARTPTSTARRLRPARCRRWSSATCCRTAPFRRLEHQEIRVGQLHGAAEVADLAGQHQPGALAPDRS